VAVLLTLSDVPTPFDLEKGEDVRVARSVVKCPSLIHHCE
jgi:hypothetical protein